MKETAAPGVRAAGILLTAAMLASACTDTARRAAPIPSASKPAATSVQPPTTAATTTTTESILVLAGTAATFNLEHPLLAELVITLDNPLIPSVRLVGPEGSHQVPVPDRAHTEHTVLLAGMRAETTYTVEIDLLDTSGAVIGRLDDQEVTTGLLPDGIPAMSATVSDPDRSAPGLTLFNLIDVRNDLSGASDGGSVPPPAGWIFMVDNEGQVVWYHQEDLPLGDVRMLNDGTLLYEYNDTAARRINLRGEVLDEWAGRVITGRLAIDAFGRQVVGDSPVIVDTDAMHHEQNRLPDGSHVTLSTELRVLDGFDEPQCGEDPAEFDGTYHLVGDVVVIFDPDTGELLQQFSLFDYFDPRDDPGAFNLCGLPFDFVFPNWLYKGVDDQARDWTHANAVTVDEAGNALIVSVRHLDAVIALRWKDDSDGVAGDLLWHSGPLGDLALIKGEWHRHQHAPEIQPDGTLLMYDNGNDRPGYGTEESPLFSRAVLFDIDPASGTIEQLWEYRSIVDGQTVYTPFVGDADRLDNDDVLITFGGINGDIEGLVAQIVEVVPSFPEGGEVVYDLRIEGEPGWIVYRAERIPSVYG